jgi:hypothetical protein
VTSTLRLELLPSRWLAACLGSLHLAALGAAFVSLSFWPLLMVAAGVVLSGLLVTVAALQRLPGAVCALELCEDGGAQWRELDGSWHAATLQNEGYLSSWLVVLRLAEVGRGRRWLVLGPDSASPDDLRRLRVLVGGFRGKGQGPAAGSHAKS